MRPQWRRYKLQKDNEVGDLSGRVEIGRNASADWKGGTPLPSNSPVLSSFVLGRDWVAAG